MSQVPTAFVKLAPVEVVKANGTRFPFGFGAATAAARGAAIHLAVAAAADGDKIQLGPGAFATAAAIDLSKGGTINIDLAGAGRGITTIQSSVILTTHGCAIHPGATCRVSDLTIDCVLTGQYQAGFGVISDLSQPVSTTARLDRVDIIGDSDGLYFKQTGACSLICRDCNFTTRWDVIYSNGTGPYTWDFHNCKFSSLGLSSVLASWKTCLIRVSGSTYRYYSCGFRADNPTVDESSSGIANGSGTVELYDCNFSVTAAEGGTALDIESTFGASVKIFGGSGSGTAGAYLTQGTVSYSGAGSTLACLKTVDGSGSGLDADTLRGSAPAAFQTASANLTTYAGITPSAVGQSLLAVADGAAGRNAIGATSGTFGASQVAGTTFSGKSSGAFSGNPAAMQLLDFATTDPSITITRAGTYLILAGAIVVDGGAESAVIVGMKVRRTNNTAADVISAHSIHLPTSAEEADYPVPLTPTIYTTANTNDVLEVWGQEATTAMTFKNAYIIAIQINTGTP